MQPPFKLTETYVHIDGDTAEIMPGGDAFWRALMGGERVLSGWLAVRMTSAQDWPHWERHPHGDEVIMVLSGRAALITDDGGAASRTEVRAGETVVMPRGVWHRAEIAEPTEMLFLTCGRGTEHRPV